MDKSSKRKKLIKLRRDLVDLERLSAFKKIDYERYCKNKYKLKQKISILEVELSER